MAGGRFPHFVSLDITVTVLMAGLVGTEVLPTGAITLLGGGIWAGVFWLMMQLESTFLLTDLLEGVSLGAASGAAAMPRLATMLTLAAMLKVVSQTESWMPWTGHMPLSVVFLEALHQCNEWLLMKFMKLSPGELYSLHLGWL